MSGAGYLFDDVSLVVEGGATILDRVTLRIPPGDITVVAGPSGAGKSTLLRLANRLEVPTGGRVLLNGTDVATLDPLVLRRRAGMVFQRPVVFAGTVQENLAVAREALTTDDCRQVLDTVGLDSSFIDRQADDLSGGEAQRMCIARTLLTEPEILLVDEATSALDVDARLFVERLTRELRDGGLTIVWVTHDLEQAERIADHTVVLMGGRVLDEVHGRRCLTARSFIDDLGQGAS